MAPQEQETVRCPVCQQPGVRQTFIPSAVLRVVNAGVQDRTGADDAYAYDCPCCGRFVVTRSDQEDLRDNDGARARWFPERLSALLREQTINGRPPYWIRFQKGDYGPLATDAFTSIDAAELLAKWPQTIPERLDRALCNIARLAPTGGSHTVLSNDERSRSLLFAIAMEEVWYIPQSLEKRGWLEQSVLGVVERKAWLTPDGWAHFDQLTRGSSSPEHPVFVAMWFGVKEKKEPSDMTTQDMTGIYMEGIKPAVARAGYRVSRVDLEEFNDSIMDKVFGDIRAAPFVVADFTGHRNGVYLEAGFARGLGRPVIQTCAESHFGKAHFDTRHLNHICWQDKADLQERLFQRIRGTIGLGPYASARRDDPA